MGLIGMFKFLFSILLFTAESWAQSGCTSTSAWTICDLTFDVAQAESSSELRAEFRSPRYKTVLIRAFRDGAKMILRFNPTGAGVWTYKLSSTLKKWDGMMGEVQATESAALGFVRATNTHHFATTLGGTDDRKPHLWMSAPVADFLTLPGNQLGPMLDARVNEKFTHIRFGIDAKTDLNEVAERMRIANAKGLVVDLVLAAIPGNDRDRESYVAEMVSRFAAFNMTWVLGPAFENVPQGRTLMKDAGNLLAKLDPYAHPRSALAQVSSGAFVGDGWMNVRSYGTVDANVGVVEHQFYQSPALNTGIASSKDLWNATMNGQYPAAGSGPHMKAWAEFMAQSRWSFRAQVVAPLAGLWFAPRCTQWH